MVKRKTTRAKKQTGGFLPALLAPLLPALLTGVLGSAASFGTGSLLKKIFGGNGMKTVKLVDKPRKVVANGHRRILKP